jgi:hypothetical protein
MCCRDTDVPVFHRRVDKGPPLLSHEYGNGNGYIQVNLARPLTDAAMK